MSRDEGRGGGGEAAVSRVAAMSRKVVEEGAVLEPKEGLFASMDGDANSNPIDARKRI